MRAAPAAAVNVLFNELDLGPEFDAFAARAMRKFDFASVVERLPTSRSRAGTSCRSAIARSG